MGVLAATVRFTSTIPSSADLITALCQHVGEPVSYQEKSGELACSASKDMGIFFASGHPQEGLWELLTGYLDGSYLWYATLVVLEKLGGRQTGFDGEEMPSMPAPIWAYRPWQLAKKEYRWRKQRKPVWITLDEARRLGVE